VDCEGPGVVSRTCWLPEGTFNVRQSPCAAGPCTYEEVPGAGVDCAPGRICALHRRADGELLSVECLDNPCGSSLVDRDCAAASICPEERRWYVQALGGGVKVDCYDWPPECPTARPRAGDPCPLDGDSCVYQDCEGAGLLLAECVDGLWTTHAEACRAGDCRDAGTCEVGDACLVVVGPGPVPGNTTYSCEPVAGEPGLVAQRMLACGQGTAMVSIYGGMLGTNCMCNAQGGCW